MRMYRDMTAEERAEADADFEFCQVVNKQDAEWEMERFDSLPPEQRELERQEAMF